MRYIPQKSPLIDKYYIWDTVEKKITTEEGYDIIIDIVADKIAIVGRATSYQSGFYYYSTYKYKLVDVKGNPISDKEFDFVYPSDSFIYCKNGDLPINKLSYLGNYMWDYDGGRYLSKYPFYFYNLNNAIVQGEFWYESYKLGYLYQYIDTKGKVLKEAKVGIKESVYQAFFESSEPNFSNQIYLDVLAESVDRKWERINELAKRTDNNYFNVCNFYLSEKYTFHNVAISFAWDRFLLLRKMEAKHSNTGTEYSKGKCVAVLNDSFDVIYYSKDGFNIYPRTFHNRIIINHEYILCSDGRLFNLPKNIKFDDFFSDNCGFAEIENNEKIGFMNNEGQIVIPPIFPKDRQKGINEEAANDAWREQQKEITRWNEDAFDGESDADWNID